MEENNVNENEEVVDPKNSILTSIKKLLGITESCTDFDTDIIMHINTILMTLNQLGVGTEGFQIEDKNAVWSEFIESDKLAATKSYVHLRVKLLFDPPLNSAIIEAIKESIRELEWRLNVRVESESEDDEEV
jgi:hypothetical protein